MTLSPRFWCLAGPTASGKTAAALAIAQALGEHKVEIISVDSALVYRGLDIGSAKPTPAERSQVKHHLIDILDPSQCYSAACFVQDAQRLIDTLNAKGCIPLLVGGTMLYFKALLEGLSPMPAASKVVRAELAQELEDRGLSTLYQELQRVDPQTAQRLSPHDTQRIGRALEVYRVSGRPLSAFHGPRQPRFQPPMISLEPANRSWLHERIAQRLHNMMQAGFIDEVLGLKSRGDLIAHTPAMRCVGYRQIWEFLQGRSQSNLPLKTHDLEQLTQACIAATRQLAKRQLTWLRPMESRFVVACDAHDVQEQVVAWALMQIDK